MNARAVPRLAGNKKVFSAVLGIAAVLTMGSLTVTHANAEADSTVKPFTELPPTVTSTAEPTPKIAFATPAVLAVPCPKRATYPCRG